MHCTQNTLDGRFGFRVLFEDGSEALETDLLWDEVPTGKRVTSLEVIDGDGLVLATLDGAERYWFANEAISVSSFRPKGDGSLQGTLEAEPILSGKLIGGVFGAQAVELKVDLLGEHGPTLMKREFEARRVRYAPAAMREGLGDYHLRME